MEQPLLVEFDAARRAVVLTLNRPARRNALDLPLLHSLRETVESVSRTHPDARLIVLRAAGSAFCSGMDLAATAGHAHETAEAVRDALLAFAECPLPTVALVQGAAVAGGMGFAAACDFVVVADGAKLGLPEVRRGLVAALVTVLLRRQLRERELRELLLAGELISAARAREIGFATSVVPVVQLDEEATRLAAALAQGGPHALAATKHLLSMLHPRSLRDEMDLAIAAHRSARDSDEAREGAAAFLEKRAPNWAASH